MLSGLLYYPVEHVEELGTELKRHALTDTEQLAEAELLIRPPSVSIVVVVCGGRTPLARPRIGPRSRIEHESLFGSMQLQFRILQEQG